MLTDREKYLVTILRKLWDDMDYICVVVQYGRNKNRIEDIIEFIEQTPDVTSDDVLEYTYCLSPKRSIGIKIQYVGNSVPFELTKGKLYDVISVENGWYRIEDDTGEDYLYPPDVFEVVENKLQS